MLLRLMFVLTIASLSAQTIQHAVVLKWVDGVNAVGTTYSMYRAPGNCSGTPVFAKISTTAITTLTYTDQTVASNTTYCYTVRAVSGTTESVNSNLTSAVIPLDVYAPTGLSVTVK